MDISFYGVRGSCPAPSPFNNRYGGNTACVALEVDDEPPIVLDLGTGLRLFDETQPHDGTFEGTALVTHIHWDHVQGLPFFSAIDRPGACFDIFGPVQEGTTLHDAMCNFMRPPYFPIEVGELRGDIVFHDVRDAELQRGNARVTVRPVPHVGPTVGYRIDWDGVSVAYISDHQAPLALDVVDKAVLELADGVDVLIHDAQFRPDEFAVKSHWGHSTIDYALLVGHLAAVERLVLFHHDPSHGDDELDGLLAGAQRSARKMNIGEVLAAREGLRLAL